MPLKGNLRDFSFVQLLNMVTLTQKTGSLVIDGAPEQAQITFRQGKLVYARLGKQDGRLAAVLQRDKKINAAQYSSIEARASQMSDKELGLLLINAGYLKQEDILQCLQEHFLGIVRQVLTWREGDFHFELDLMPPDDQITINLGLENLIGETTRQANELEQLKNEIPNLDLALKFTDHPGIDIHNINLSPQEWQVISAIHPKNTLQQILQATKMNDLEIRRVVHRLLQAGLVEVISPR